MDISFSAKEKRVFKRLGVSAVVLFGSRATGLARDSSDYDFGVLLESGGRQQLQKHRGALFDLLHDIFASHINRLVNIDVVFLQTAPGELQAHALKHARILYEEQKNIVANFKAQVMEAYADFEPLREIFHKGILARIKT